MRLGPCSVVLTMSWLFAPWAHAQVSTTQPSTRPVPDLPRYGAWQSSRIGGGGYLQNVVVAPSKPNRCYAYLAIGGPYRSDDAGLTWRSLQGNLPARRGNYSVRSLLVDPRDPNHVLIAVGSQWEPKEGVYLSRDGGDSWTKTLDASFQNDDFRNAGFVLARHPKNPDTVLVAAIETGVWRSTDNGQRWQNLGPKDINPTDLRFDQANPDRLWLCAIAQDTHVNGVQRAVGGGFYRSTDAGKSWVRLSNESPTEILQDPNDPNRIYGIFNRQVIKTSLDEGDSWQDLSDGLPIDPDQNGWASEHRFIALAAGPDFILTASSRGTFYRLDCGQTTWRKIDRQGIHEGDWFGRITPGQFQHFGAALGSITVDPHNPNHWFFTDWFAIYQTHDAGLNWKLTIHGIEATVINQLLQDPSDPAVVHLAMADNGYFKSTDGGRGFRQVQLPGGGAHLKDLALSPKLPARVYAVGSTDWQRVSNQLYISNDSGESWQRSPMTGLPDLAKYRCNSLAVDPANPDVVYLALSGNVAPNAGGPYRSTDAGQTWTWIGQGLPENQPFYRHEIWEGSREIAAGAAGNLLTLSQQTSRVFRFDSKANTWLATELSPATTPNSLCADYFHPGRFYLGAEHGVYRSNDGGVSWERLHETQVAHIAADTAVAHRVAASTADGVILTRDAGKTWSMLDKSLPDRVRSNMPAFAGERLIVGSRGSGAFWMPLSRDGEKPVKARPATPAPSTRGS